MQTRQKTISNQQTGAAPAAAPATSIDPFAADTAQSAQTMPATRRTGRTADYPVPVDGEMRQLTLDELIQAQAWAVQAERLHSPQPRGKRHAQRPDLCGLR